MPADQIVVERLIAGQLTAPQVRTADRDAAIRQLRASGLTPPQIGTRLGTTSAVVRAVLRTRKATP